MRNTNRNVVLSQQFLPAICQISSEFSVFQQDSAPEYGVLRQSIFLPITSPDVDRLKILLKQTRQQICNKLIVTDSTTPKSRC